MPTQMNSANNHQSLLKVYNLGVTFTDEKIDPKDMIMPMEEDLFVQILKNFNDRKEF